jgi:hypothetical protein
METVPASETLGQQTYTTQWAYPTLMSVLFRWSLKAENKDNLKRMVMPLSDLQSWQRPLSLSVFMTSIFMSKQWLTEGKTS